MGQVPNQVGPQLPHLPQQNGCSLSPQIQSLGGLHGTWSMDSDLETIRAYMRDRIYQKLMQQRPQTTIEMQQKLKDVVKRVEERLFKVAASKEEYMDVSTLEHRLHTLIKRSNHSQQLPSSTVPSTIGKMIPTPGMSHSGSLNLTGTSSLQNSGIATGGYTTSSTNTFNTRNLVPNANGPTGGVDGPLSNGYQQSPAIGSGGNNMIPSVAVQRVSSQMIPTPGLNNSQLCINSESSNTGGRLSGAESTMSQLPPKQYIGGRSFGDQVGVGMRSTLQNNLSSYGFPNGSLNAGLGLTENNTHPVNGPTMSESYLTASPYSTSSKHLHQQRTMPVPGDGFGMMADLAVSENLYGIAPARPMMSNQNINPGSMQSISKTSQPNVHATEQKTHIKPQMFDPSSKENAQATHASQKQLQKFQQNQSVENPHLFQEQQFAQHQIKQQAQQRQQLALKNDSLRQSHLASNLGSQVMSDYNDVMDSQMGSFNQVQQNNARDSSRVTQMLCQPSGIQKDCSSSHNSLHMHTDQSHPESQNTFSCLSTRAETEAAQGHSKLQDKPQISALSLHEQDVQEEFHQRIRGQDEARRPHPFSEGSITGHPAVSVSTTVPPNISTCGHGNATSEQQCRDQQRWLLFLMHARRCSAPEGKCQEVNCITVQKLLRHMKSCKSGQCRYPRCANTRILIDHHKNCRLQCPICVPVRRYIKVRKARICPSSDCGLLNSKNGSWIPLDDRDAVRLPSKFSQSTDGISEDIQSSVKRMKTQHISPSFMVKVESSPASFPAENLPLVSRDAQNQVCQEAGVPIPMKPGAAKVKAEPSLSSGLVNPNINEVKKDEAVDSYNKKLDVESIIPMEPAGVAKLEDVEAENGINEAKPEVEQDFTVLPSAHATPTKLGRPKVQGVSLIELFTPEQIREHINSLKQWTGQSKAKAEKHQAMEHSTNENSCQLCKVEKLYFAPPPIYCYPCNARVKRNTMYYTMAAGDSRYYFCIPCYNEARGDTIEVDGTPIAKARLEKKRNDEETEEAWVQCDKCEAWQHQICALFNCRRNDGGDAEYTCPSCFMTEVKRGERMPLPQSSVLGAKDLPRTILSDHIEQRLFRRLKQERQDRAGVLGKNLDEVPGAEALVVRVVSSVDKKLEVKPRFLEIFQEQNFPTEFPYKSKVVLLFQKIDNVEVCLFGMYVQEFGSDCPQPNQRRVYLSYLDSVKYFRPEIRTVSGEALRTFVYHEILIGYLEYCKRRGFTSCYIWACPPLKGEDYILYCHPEIQKTPKSDKLREWYLSMLKKATRENIVVDLSNLYDQFFVSASERKAKVTAARLPYFDGDYWPGAAEDMINQFHQEEDGRKQQKKGKLKKFITKRALKAVGQTDLSVNASKDILLMQKLGETICPMKEDFIMVHLQHPCAHCCHLMVSGNRWVCNQCKNFQLCDKCHDAEKRLDERSRHPTQSRDKHALYPVEVSDVPEDTKDEDEILESEFFDTRQAFLSLCQGNHYQYDTLRRAKHSSMMVLYHLHNPTAPAFVTTCNVCQKDVEAGQGWRCEICPEFDVCDACYQKEGGVNHMHKLTNRPSTDGCDAQNKEARQQRVLQLRRMLDLLVHASQCRSPHCAYPNCRKVKGLFRHGMQCKIRIAGGCGLCKKMWYILQLHARACKESECRVPRCRDLKDHLRRLQQQSDSRRRAAVMEMMRQRAAEVAGNSG